MTIKHQISTAITAHEQWKQTLVQAIETGVCRTHPDEVSEDTNCQLGKWLLDLAGTDDALSLHYASVVNLHAEFHREAGEILKLAMCGGKSTARKRLGHEYKTVSENLIRELRAWDSNL